MKFIQTIVGSYEQLKSVSQEMKPLVVVSGIINSPLILYLIGSHSFSWQDVLIQIIILVSLTAAILLVVAYYKIHCAILEIKDAHSFDYKFCATTNSKSVARLIDAFDNEATINHPVFLQKGKDKKYIPPHDFFSPSNKDNFFTDFKCIPVKEKDKGAYCFAQVSFIPIDENDNIPLILRLPVNHSSVAKNILNKDPTSFSFLSFSPVPMRYKNAFSLNDCFHREVPNQETHPALDDIEMILQKRSDNIYYFFYIILARYEGSFLQDDNKPNWKRLEQLFALEKSGMTNEELTDPKNRQKIKFFQKDHDPIVHVASLKTLYNYFCLDGTGKANLSDKEKQDIKNLAKALETAYKYELTSKLKINRSISLFKVKFMPVEKDVISRLATKRKQNKSYSS